MCIYVSLAKSIAIDKQLHLTFYMVEIAYPWPNVN